MRGVGSVNILTKTMVLVILACLATAILCQPIQAADTTATTQPKGKSPSGALLRSLVVPGWGQLYNGKYLKALIYAGAQVSFAYAAYVQNDRYHHYRNLDDDYLAGFYKDDRNRMFWWILGVTLMSIGDAYVDAHLWNFDVSDDLSASIAPQFDPENRQVALSCTIRLNIRQ